MKAENKTNVKRTHRKNLKALTVYPELANRSFRKSSVVEGLGEERKKQKHSVYKGQKKNRTFSDVNNNAKLLVEWNNR